VLDDIRSDGNEQCLLPGEIEHRAAQRSAEAGGLLFTEAELAELRQIADRCGVTLEPAPLQQAGA
jgi:L-2-hydroxycarboxylate dehydrogenase (NAD+)